MTRSLSVEVQSRTGTLQTVRRSIAATDASMRVRWCGFVPILPLREVLGAVLGLHQSHRHGSPDNQRRRHGWAATHSAWRDLRHIGLAGSCGCRQHGLRMHCLDLRLVRHLPSCTRGRRAHGSGGNSWRSLWPPAKFLLVRAPRSLRSASTRTWSHSRRYDAPVLSYLYVWNGPASGGSDVEVHGSNFGNPENVGLFLNPNGQPQVTSRLAPPLPLTPCMAQAHGSCYLPTCGACSLSSL
jgi:hypothetical protein